MSSSKISSTILLISFALLLQTSLGEDPLSYICSNTQNFTSNTPFDSSLKTLIAVLNYQTPLSGFSQASFGQYYNQQAYGLSLCRGDISSSDCETCVYEAASQLLKRCSYNKGAIIWYDNCMFKYIDQDFLGHIDNSNKFYLFNTQNVSDVNPDSFNYKTKELLNRLSEEAHLSPKMYAAGEIMVEEGKNVTVYGLTQCTRDLSSDDCNKCLYDAIGELLPVGKQGGRVVGGSCNVRYEIYPFFKE